MKEPYEPGYPVLTKRLSNESLWYGGIAQQTSFRLDLRLECEKARGKRQQDMKELAGLDVKVLGDIILEYPR